MSRTPPLSTRLTSYLTQPFRRAFTRTRGKRSVVTQTSPSTDTLHSFSIHGGLTPTVFQLPYEIFEEVLLNFPILPWTEVYHRHFCAIEDVWFHPASNAFWERTRALLALSATCRAMRQMFLMEAWNVYVACSPRKRSPRRPVRYKPRSDVLLSRYRILLGNPRLAANVRYSSLVVNLEYLDPSSDHSKDTGGRFRVHFRQTRGSLCRMPHRLTQPPHP